MWPALMGLGLTGSLPYLLFCLFIILAMNSVRIVVCVCQEETARAKLEVLIEKVS